MPLTDQQLGAIGAVEWLFDHSPLHRRSGRTLVLAVAAIRVACQHPGEWVQIVDHVPGREPANNLCRMIETLVRSDPQLAPFFTLNRQATQERRLRIELPRPLRHWLPSEEALGRNIPITERARENALTQRELWAQEYVQQERVFANLLEAEFEPNMNGDVFPEALIRAATFDPERDIPEALTVDIPEPPSKWERLLGDDEI